MCCQEAVLLAIHHGCTGAKQWAELNFKELSWERTRLGVVCGCSCNEEQ